MFKKATPEEQAANDAAKAAKRAAKEREEVAKRADKEREAFLRTPVGQARTAFERGDHLFQYAHDAESQNAVIVSMVGSTTNRSSSDPRAPAQLAGAGPSAALRAIIADGNRFYRDGLALLLRESAIDVIGEVSTGEAALEAVQQTAPDVVIMDFDVPGLSGLEAIRRIGEQAPETGVLILSDVAQEAAVTDAIGARGGAYLLKDRPVGEILAAVRAAAARPAGEDERGGRPSRRLDAR